MGPASGEDRSPGEIDRRVAWFQEYAARLDSQTAELPLRCPCCGCLTLGERGGYEVCPVCLWEDDGQDDHDADVVRGGPNRGLSLAEARENYQRFGACDEVSKTHVRLPRPDERPGENPR
jgi:Cysteine-rich CPCC